MDKYYKTVATLHLQHEFYADKALPSATINPFNDTALFFRNHRMIFKRKTNHYIILQEANTGSNEPTISFGSDPRFLFFGINFNDRDYQLRSGLNFDPRTNKIVASTDKEEIILVDDKNVMPVWNQLRLEGSEPLQIIKDGEPVFSSETDGKAEFNAFADGVYEANGLRFLKCSNVSQFDAILILKLTEQETVIDRKIVFPAGSYHWRYQVMKKYTKHNALSLIDDNEKVTFKSVESGEETRSVFFSSEPVKLSQQVITSLTLYNDQTIVKKFLPLPSLENARFASETERFLVLEAYVTI